ncbi:MAG: DUF1559 domain-containing protein [Planctomycetales bacterium]
MNRDRTSWTLFSLSLLVLVLLGCGGETNFADNEAGGSAVSPQSLDNLKNIVFGMHDFEINANKLPPQGSLDDRTPRFSWRVHILPSLNATDLHGRFKFDEPWDSPHNLEVAKAMPEVFKSPGGDLPAGMTRYQVVMMEGSVFNRKKPLNLGMLSSQDGAAQTIGVVEVNADIAVFWTKPADFQVNPDNPKDGLGGDRDGILAAFMDGTATVLSKDIAPEHLKAMFTADGGEIVPLDTFNK